MPDELLPSINDLDVLPDMLCEYELSAEEKDFLDVFKILSDRTRFRLFKIIAADPNSELCVGDLCELVGQSQPAASHHLSLMRAAGLLQATRVGKENHYSITRRAVAVFTTMARTLSRLSETPEDKKVRKSVEE